MKEFRDKKTTACTAIVLGSGGHTTEMLRLLGTLDKQVFTPRIYYIANTDTFSRKKLELFEQNRTDYTVNRIPRAREVGQSPLSSLFSLISATIACFHPAVERRVDLLLVNGPGLCLPVCICHKLTHGFLQLIYIESICRVKTLSLTCHIVRWFASVTLVQWPELAEKYRRTTYIGRIL